MTKFVIIVANANYNSVIGVQSTGNYAATESKEQGAEEELQKDSPA